MKKDRWLKQLQITALAIVVVTLLVWMTNGAHTGWTQTSVVEMKIDEITRIEYPVRHDEFIAGVEVLGLGFILAGLVSGLGFLPAVVRKLRAGRY